MLDAAIYEFTGGWKCEFGYELDYKKSWICVVLASICGNFPAVGDVYMMDSEWLFQPFCYIDISSFLELVYQVYINY